MRLSLEVQRHEAQSLSENNVTNRTSIANYIIFEINEISIYSNIWFTLKYCRFVVRHGGQNETRDHMRSQDKGQ